MDYSPESFEVTFTSGSTRQCVDVEIEDDPDPEDDEMFEIVIPPGPDVVPGPNNTTKVTILDNGRLIFNTYEINDCPWNDGFYSMQM